MAAPEKTAMHEHQEQNISCYESKIRPDDAQDGDLALTVLHTHFEPYTKDEEKRILRKIDFRLALLMLFVNGIQFVDKLVSNDSCTVLVYVLLTDQSDHLPGRHLRPYQGSPPQGSGVFADALNLLHRLPSRTIPNQCPHATLPYWQIYHCQLRLVGIGLDLHGILHQFWPVHGGSIFPGCLRVLPHPWLCSDHIILVEEGGAASSYRRVVLRQWSHLHTLRLHLLWHRPLARQGTFPLPVDVHLLRSLHGLVWYDPMVLVAGLTHDGKVAQ
jgi:hypothetical protein